MLQGKTSSIAAAAAPHPQAAIAAHKILTSGGNAVDAAIAAMLALTIVTPSQTGLGGFGGCMVAQFANSKSPVAFDFDSFAPLNFKPELYSNPEAANIGYLATTVPGNARGLHEALGRFGTMPWSKVCDHAANLAEHGFPMEAPLHQQLQNWKPKADATSFKAFFPSGSIPEIGQNFYQRDMARLLRRIGDEGIEIFYKGDVAEQILKQVRANGGILSQEDFNRFAPRVVDPIGITYRDHQILTPPPPSGGLSMLQILKVMEQFDLAKVEPWTAAYYHLFAEATKLCWQDRIRVLGDPDFTPMPIDELLSEEKAKGIAARIRTGIARNTAAMPKGPPHTANISIIDSQRNIVSLTATQGLLFGSHVVIDGLGLVMGHGMSRFTFQEKHPNAPAPGKRMYHNMAPTIALYGGQPYCAVGLPGAAKIVTVTAQLLMNLIDFHKTPAESVVAPRIHNEGDAIIAISSKVPDSVKSELAGMGHSVVRGQTFGGPPNEIGSFANIVQFDATKNVIRGASGYGDDAVAALE